MNETATLADRWGTAVACRRKLVGLSQMALANDCGVTQQTISSIERGKSIPSDPLKLEIARALDIAPGDLFAWPDEVAA